VISHVRGLFLSGDKSCKRKWIQDCDYYKQNISVVICHTDSVWWL